MFRDNGYSLTGMESNYVCIAVNFLDLERIISIQIYYSLRGEDNLKARINL